MLSFLFVATCEVLEGHYPVSPHRALPASPRITLAALPCTFSRLSTSFFNCVAQNWTQDSSCITLLAHGWLVTYSNPKILLLSPVFPILWQALGLLSRLQDLPFVPAEFPSVALCPVHQPFGITLYLISVFQGLSGRFIITALPTIYHCKDGEFRRYQGPRTKTDFINFISEQEWKSVEPVSSWFGPSSFLMSSMSALFQLSMWIRHCHSYLTEHLGIPVWGSYAVFTLVTLFSGLLLGLVMVFVADCLCPSKKQRPPQNPCRKKLPESPQRMKTTRAGRGEEASEGEGEPGALPPPAPPPGAVRQRIVVPADEEQA